MLNLRLTNRASIVSAITAFGAAMALSSLGCQSRAPQPETQTKAANQPAAAPVAAPVTAGPAAANTPEASPPEPNLTQIEAKARARAIRDIAYELSIGLDADSDWFKGELSTRFERTQDATASSANDELFMDFRSGGVVESIQVNGASIDPKSYAKNRISLPKSALKTGGNHVVIRYRQKFTNTGRGFYRFKDPEDQRVYTFTHFEPFDAHQFFPSFDQPDLKATMKLQVEAPADWTVISTTRETKKDPLAEQPQRRLWDFPVSAKLSTYLFSLHAGQYHEFSAQAGNVPLRLFVRQSLKDFVQPKDWFVPTQAGMKFFGDLYGVAYPFFKYDQIIVPDFNSGAMENVAAVTFSERYVRRGKPTRDNRMSLASVIMHELAHQWFGNLVTMQWWDGLWLNESFASYMAALALYEATEFKEAWQDFYTGYKSWAYFTDQLVTTHPIQGAVGDTRNAFTNFDGITYGKGASSLKQLSYYLGSKKFRDGLRIYFKRHAYQNTQIGEFLKALEDGAGQDLSSWSKQWLETSGVDSLQARYECSRGKLTKFELVATPAPGQTSIRPHRTLVGLYGERGGKIVVAHSVQVEYTGPVTNVQSVVGKGCPVMVYPNLDDHDYVKVRLDKRTVDAVSQNLARISDPFARLLFYPNLFEMVRDSELLPQDYLEIVARNLPRERDEKIVEEMLETIGAGRQSHGTSIYYLPQGTPTSDRARLDWIKKFEQLLLARTESAAAGSDEQKYSFDGLRNVTQSPGGAAVLADILEGKRKLKGFELDQDRRWSVVTRLSSLGFSRAPQLLEKEKERDKSERGIQSALSAEASVPKLEVKEQWMEKVAVKDQMTSARTRAVLSALLPTTQTPLRAALTERFFTSLQKLAGERDHSFSERYADALMPALCTVESAKRLAQFAADKAASLPPGVIKSLRNGAQEDERCANVRKRSTAALAP